jgi:primosomal protein N'
MAQILSTESESAEFYCPQCQRPVPDPLTCGDCGSQICRQCGTPLERIDDLGIG